MVAPISDEDRQKGNRILVIGFVGFVGLSAVFMAAYGGASLDEIAVISVLGAATAIVLVIVLGVRY